MTSDRVYKLIEDNGLTLHGDIEHFASLVVDTFYAKFYTTPPQRKPLSDDEIALIVAECASSAHRHDDFSFARAIEAAHGIKENT